MAGVAIVGAGVAGLTAAETLRELGYDGALTVYGSEAAAPYDRPTLSKSFLLADDPAEPPPLRPEGAFEALDVAFECGVEVTALDAGRRTLTTAAGDQVAYGRLLLATGAQPRRLELPGADLVGIHYLRELAGARDLRSALRSGGRVAIVGGGVIGLEVAASAVALGAAVTVIEAGPNVMGRVVPAAFATLLEDLHRERGVTIATGVRPLAFEGESGHVTDVGLEDGGRVAADVVIVGVGVVPSTGLAVGAGLTVEDGIVVDEQFRTSDPHVFAAGDVARVLHVGEQRHVRNEQWRSAEEQGRHVAASMLGQGGAYGDVPWMWSDQHALHIQATGFGFAGTEVVRRGDVGDRGGVLYLGTRDSRLVAACGVSVGTGVARGIRAAQGLIEQGAEVDLDQLADAAIDVRRLANVKTV